jgi:hypothetical protein
MALDLKLCVLAHCSRTFALFSGLDAHIRAYCFHKERRKQMSRMKLTKTSNYVTLSYTEPVTGEREIREFHVPFSGGYVREGDKQVCENLSHFGSTLTADPETLADVIRQEYRSLMRNQQKWLA